MFSKIMNINFHTIEAYFAYLLNASTKHKIHSPFVFHLVNDIFEKQLDYPVFESIEFIREDLLRNQNIITIEDFGAGSKIFKSNQRKIADIAKNSVKKEKYAHLLFMLIRNLKLNSILELGTSLGITTSYLASAHKNVQVTTVEGCSEIAKIANQTFEKLKLKNIQLITGKFETELEKICQATEKLDLIFIDGNHKENATIEYFKTILPFCHNDTVLVFDDIHWSEEMEEAWSFIKNHDKVTLTIDIFEMGLVFLRKENRQKEHFVVLF